MKIAINGFGRIGRTILRAWIVGNNKDIEISHINSTSSISESLHLLEFDSTFGRLKADIKIISESEFSINGKKITLSSERDPAKIDWSKFDAVMECTGKFLTQESVKPHFQAGAKKIIFSAPAKDKNTTTCILGVNQNVLKLNDSAVSIGSCTTNCLAPIVKIINDNFGIKNGFVTTVHAYTSDQNILDNSHTDLRRARSAAVSMVPTSTGVAKALSVVLPDVGSKIDGSAIRVPVCNVSVVDLTVSIEKNTTADDVNKIFEQYANGEMKGVLGIEKRPLVSCDFIGSSFSSTVDTLETRLIGGNLLRVLAWYDNEWGFSNRMLDVARIISGR